MLYIRINQTVILHFQVLLAMQMQSYGMFLEKRALSKLHHLVYFAF